MLLSGFTGRQHLWGFLLTKLIRYTTGLLNQCLTNLSRHELRLAATHYAVVMVSGTFWCKTVLHCLVLQQSSCPGLQLHCSLQVLALLQ